MPINPIMFILGRQLAINNGVSTGQANTDGLLAGIMSPAALGLVLATVLSENQESEAPSTVVPPVVSTALATPAGNNTTTVALTGNGFGTVPTAVTVVFTWTATGASVPSISAIPLQQGAMGFSSTTITVTLPPGVPVSPTPAVMVAVIVNGTPSIATQLTQSQG